MRNVYLTAFGQLAYTQEGIEYATELAEKVNNIASLKDAHAMISELENPCEQRNVEQIRCFVMELLKNGVQRYAR